MSYRTDRAWGDSLIPEAVQLIAPHVIVRADDKRDWTEATDLVVLHTADGGIAFRCRRADGGERRWGHQFTVRYSKPSGAATEFEKFMSGCADWMFYGWHNGTTFTHWMLLDLGLFRWWIGEHPELVRPITNRDGTAFCAFSIYDFPEQLIIDKSEAHHDQLAA